MVVLRPPSRLCDAITTTTLPAVGVVVWRPMVAVPILRSSANHSSSSRGREVMGYKLSAEMDHLVKWFKEESERKRKVRVSGGWLCFERDVDGRDAHLDA